MKTLHTIYTNFAKRNLASLRLLLVMLLTLSVSTAWADYTIAFKTGSGSEVTTKAAIIDSGGDYVSSVSAAKTYAESTGLRYGSGSAMGYTTFTLSSAGQIKASKIIFQGAKYYSSDNSSLKYTITYTDATTTSGTIALTSTATDKEAPLESSKTISQIDIRKTAKNDRRFYVQGVTVVAASAAPSFTITATSNNDSYGTVSVSGTTITATPKDGYRVSTSSPYDVTVGTATVVDNGNNTFTVTPESECTVQINFESKGCIDKGASSITSGTFIGDDYGPLHAYYGYSTSQILYTKSDLDLATGKKGSIKSIYFEYAGSSEMDARTINIYMANTTLSSLSTSSYVPYSSFSLVYEGSFSCSSAGWYEITLDTPFEYSGTGNLAVMVDDNTNSYQDSKNFKYHSANGAQIYKRQDNTDIDPENWTPASKIDYRPNTKFCIQEVDMTPVTVTLMDNGATITEDLAGAGVTLPPRDGCDGYEFVGWTKSWTTNQTSWTTTAPEIIPAGDYTPTEDVSLYPVYTKAVSGGTTQYVLTDITSIVPGDIFVLADASDYAMTNNNGTNNGPSPNAITISNNKITSSVDATIEWQLTGNATDGYTFYPASGTSVWLYCNTTATSGSNNNMRVGTGNRKLFVVNNKGYLVTNDDKTDRYLSRYDENGTPKDFRGYINTNTNPVQPKLYKKTGGSTTYYISVPDCCTQLAEVTNLKFSSITSNSITIAVPDDYSDYANASGYTFNCYSALTGGTLIATADESGTSHTFTGLTKNTTYYFTVIAKGEGKYCNSIETSPRESSKTLAQYTVILNPNGGSGTFTGWTANGSNYTKTVDAGTKITLPELSKTGYDFAGWNDGTTTVTSPYTLTGNTTLTAHWTPQTYNITYKDQGDVAFSGTHENNYPTQHTYGKETTLKGATKTGYTFEGWYKEAACTNKVTTLGATEYTGTITLYAMWIVNTHTLTWNVNGGDALTGTYTSGTVEYGAEITPPNFPTRNGYDFTYWYDGTNMVEHNNLLKTMPDHDLTYTAQWEAVVYGISYQGLEGASNNANNPDTYTIESETITFLPPGERTGYKFTGWTPTSITKGSTGDITVTANWTAKALVNYRTTCLPIYEVTLNPDGGTIADNEWGYDNTTGYYTKKVIEGYDVSLPVATKAGYTNTGWKTNPTTNVVSNPYTVNGDVTLIAAYDCALASVGISGTYALTVGDVFELVATAYDSNGDVLTCPANTTYSWERYNSVNEKWEAITDDNSDGDDAKLTFNNCQIANCGAYRCHVSYGECEASSHTTAADGGFNVHCFHLKGNFEGNWNKEYAFNHTDEEGIATLSMDLLTGQTFEFKIYDGITQYGNGGTIETSVTGWTYGTDNQSNTIFKTGADGTYIFKLDFKRLINSENILVLDVTYPPANQAEGHTIYYDNLVHKWENVYYRIGHNRDNGDGTWGWNQNQKMTKVPGTSHLYTTKTPQFDNFEAWHIANNVSWADKNSIYLVNPDGTEYDITHATEYKKFVVVEDITLTPDADGTFVNGENCTYYPAAKQAGMKKHNAKIIASPTGGTITVSYTDHDGTDKSDFTSGARDLAHTCLLTITATPAAGYSGALTVNGEPFISGNVHTLAEDAVIEVVWTEKDVPTFEWSAATCTAALEAVNTFPTLNNPNSLSPVTYESSNTGVATIDADGNITLVATGTTTITATGAESATHKSATDTYELIVVAANCKWVEVTDNATLEDGDEVVITMTKYGSNGLPYTYTLPNTKNTSTAPEANDITANIQGNYLTTVRDEYKWVIEKDNANLTFYSYSDNANYLYCTNADNGNGVRVGTGAAKVFVVDGNYLKNTQTTVPRYVGISFNTNPYSWRCYTDTTGVIANETLKFYKRECLDATNYWVTWDAGEGAWTDGSSKKLESYQVDATIIKPTEPTREGYRFDGWTPAPTTMPAKNTTFTAVWTKVYKVTWYENGVPSYTYVPSDNAVVTWEDNIADCGEKKFYGWTADDTFVSDPTTPPTLISKGTTIAGDVTYYAVYADAVKPANPGYTKVTTISEGTYLIATDNTANKAYTGRSGTNTYGGYCDVEIVDNVIKKLESAVEVEVTLNGSNFYMHDGTYYLGYTSGNAMTFDASIQTGNQNIWKLTAEGYIESVNVTGRILQYNSGSPRFACYSTNQKKAYLYKKQTTTYKNFAVSCATYTITVTTPTGGTVTTTPADEAGAGQEITINVTPDDCKYLTALKYNDGSDHSINISSTSYTFTMPAADVTVTATFADKTATDIEILTSAHRLLMQGSAFVGEQVRITYNNGDKETLNWNDSRLTFTGHNTATLGSQTVTVTYNDCGTQSASYNIEVIDGLGITFWDGNYTEVVKYEPGDLVDVDNRIGQNICSGWEFVGWSETKVANESNGFTPVHNFNATDAKVLYAVYVETSTDWISAYNIDELHPGAKYVIVYHYDDSKEYALTNTNNTNSSYLDGANLTTDCEEVREGDAYPYKDRYKLKVTPDENWKWQLENTGSGWTMRNIKANKYLKINTDKTISLTTTPDDKFTLSNGYNDSEITAKSSSNNYLSWYNSYKYWNGHTSGQQYYLTNETNFTSTPPCSPLSATFHGNGGIVTDGVNSGDDLTITEPTRDAGITTPTASFDDCNGKSWTFVGWAREEIDVTRVPVLTTDLLHDGGGNKHYYIQEEDEEFWAVYTNQGTPETKYGTITFTKENFPNTYVNISKSCTIVENGDSYNFDYTNVAKPSGNSIQIQEGEGYLTNTTSLGKINSISFTNFIYGNINCLKVSLGTSADALTTVLTAEELQVVDGVYTYYPKANYSFFKIESIEDAGAVGIETISIDFGKGTQVWGTTPDCSTITLSGDEIYITATNGRAIMASAPIAVKANQLEANADVILTSNSGDVYFSLNRDFNFAAGQAANQKPTTSLTLSTNAEGNLATTDVYIHYMPSSEGDGVPANVIISANLETPNPSITDDHTIHVRNLPAKFVIATKVGATWYALPADMMDDTNPLAEVIEVDETTMTATAPNTSTYTLWPVKTTNGTENRYADYGDRVRFAAVNNEQRGLWANNNNNSSAIRNYAVINSLGADGLAGYEWKITTTVVDGHWQYTLQTDQTQNQNYLRYWTSAEGTPVGPKWGTYNAGENKLYFLPVTETQPFEYAVVEWYPTKVLIQTDAAITSPTVKVGGEEVASPELTSKGGKLYEISNLPLETNPNKLLQVSFTDDAINYTNTKVVPIILSRGAKTITGEPFATLTQKVYQYADVVVRDGATLSVNGDTDVANTMLGVTIYPTAKVSVEEGKKLSVHSLTFFGGIDEIYNGSTYEINKYGVPQLSLKGILNKTITNMDYIMRVDLEQMYQVGVPYDVNLSDITYWDCTAMTLGDNLYVSAYDGQKRANLEPTGSWVWEVNFEVPILKAGIGYTISADKQDAAHEYSIIRMPMKNNITSGNTEIAKTVQVYAYANTNDVEITDNNKGWNYLSNPYMAAISGAEADSKLVVGYLDRNEVTEPWEWVNDTYRYVTIPSDDGTYHYQQKFKDAILNPFKSFFLQIAAEGELSFDLASRQSAPARYLQTNTEKREVEFEVLLANDTRSDNLGFLIGEDYTPAYEINADLEKMIGSMSVYTIYNGYNLAYNALSPANAAEQIPIGYVVPTVGEYTFALDESSDIEDVEHIYLIDYETSAITDLVTDVYTFTASEQKSDTRFAINVTLKSKESTVTGLVNINKDSEQSLKFIHNDKIYILHNGVIYDATGKFVETINK